MSFPESEGVRREWCVWWDVLCVCAGPPAPPLGEGDGYWLEFGLGLGRVGLGYKPCFGWGKERGWGVGDEGDPASLTWGGELERAGARAAKVVFFMFLRNRLE